METSIDKLTENENRKECVSDQQEEYFSEEMKMDLDITSERNLKEVNIIVTEDVLKNSMQQKNTIDKFLNEEKHEINLEKDRDKMETSTDKLTEKENRKEYVRDQQEEYFSEEMKMDLGVTSERNLKVNISVTKDVLKNSLQKKTIDHEENSEIKLEKDHAQLVLENETRQLQSETFNSSNPKNETSLFIKSGSKNVKTEYPKKFYDTDNEQKHEIKLEKDHDQIVLENEATQFQSENSNSSSPKNETFIKSESKNVKAEYPKKKSYDPFEVLVPLIGRHVIKAPDCEPFTKNYDLARERNRMRHEAEANKIPKLDYKEWRKIRDSRTDEEKNLEEKKRHKRALREAYHITAIAIAILKELKEENFNEKRIINLFRCFLNSSMSPLALVYAPHFVHTMMLCRGYENFSPKIRKIANECYLTCHVMFPLPEGYNFETVYTSDCIKYTPEGFDGLLDMPLDYGDYDDSSDESLDN